MKQVNAAMLYLFHTFHPLLSWGKYSVFSMAVRILHCYYILRQMFSAIAFGVLVVMRLSFPHIIKECLEPWKSIRWLSIQ
jgi:hypothetical protein